MRVLLFYVYLYSKKFFMKKIIYFLLLLFPLFSMGQNGGQLNENSVIKIDYLGYANGNHTFKVTNKQPCQVKTQYTVVGSSTITDTVVGANGSYLIIIPSQLSEIKVTKARTVEFCPNVAPDRGWVERDNTQPVLPIKFKSITARRLDMSTIRLVFESEEDNTIRYYNIRISFDNRVWKTFTILFPDGVQGSKRYQVDLKNITNKK